MTTEPNLVEWTPDKLIHFKAAYRAAVIAKHETFEFEGNEYVLGYAKYLIEFLEREFARE